MVPKAKEEAPTPEIESIEEAQTRLFRDARSGDITIRCGKKAWKCHSDILAQRCKFFRAACGGKFKESVTRTIDLSDDKEESVDMMLLYIYTMDGPTDIDFETAEQAYIIGDKYQLQGLKSAGRDVVKESIRDNLPKIASQSKEDMNDMRGWTDFIERLLDGELPDAETLKECLLDKLAGVSKHMIRELGFQELLEKNREFNLEFVTALANKASETSDTRSVPIPTVTRPVHDSNGWGNWDDRW